jgi:hypothetical protein
MPVSGAIAHRFRRDINSTKIRINLFITSFFSTKMKYFYHERCSVPKDGTYIPAHGTQVHPMEFTFQPME